MNQIMSPLRFIKQLWDNPQQPKNESTMKTNNTTPKNLADYSKDELIELLTNIEDQYNSKSERLKKIVTKLTQAKLTIKTQKKSLQHLRKRIVELTPAQQARL
jgi:predicted nuclease with TOPRIM domain